MQNYRRETASPEELSADRPFIWPRPWVPFPAGQDRLLWSLWRGRGAARRSGWRRGRSESKKPAQGGLLESGGL